MPERADPDKKLISVGDFNPDELAAWAVACKRGIAMTCNDLRAIINAYEWGRDDA